MRGPRRVPWGDAAGINTIEPPGNPSRIRQACTAAALASALLLSACGPKAEAPASPGLTPVRLDIDWYPEAELAGFYQALARGYYREAGLDVSITPGGVGTHPNLELVMGVAQFATASSDDVIEQAQQGLPLYIVGAFMERYPEAILVHEDSPVRSIRDLDGRVVIAVPGNGWIAHVERKYGIRINVEPAAFEITRFMADPGAIQQVYVSSEPYFVRRKGVKTRMLMISDTGYNPYRVIIATKAYAQAHPEVVRAFVSASMRGWVDVMSGDPAPSRQLILALNTQIDRDYFDATLRTLSEYHIVSGQPERGEYLGALSLARLQEQIDLLARIGFVHGSFPASGIATAEFSPPAPR
jgi:NitT/TauT family transport system substrate-binding protein